jgi:hypothetical protein
VTDPHTALPAAEGGAVGLEGATLDPSGVDFAFGVSEEGVPGLGVLDAESFAHFVVDPDDVCVNFVVTSRDPAEVELGLDATHKKRARNRSHDNNKDAMTGFRARKHEHFNVNCGQSSGRQAHL